MKRSMMQHFIRTLSALTVLSSALLAAPDEPVAKQVRRQTKSLLRTYGPTGAYLLGTGALAAGAYATWKYWPQMPAGESLEDGPLFEGEKEIVATVRSLLETRQRFSEPHYYPKYLAELYNMMLGCLSTKAENRVELARALQGLFTDLLQNYTGYVAKHPEAWLPDEMYAMQLCARTNVDGFAQLADTSIAKLLCCTSGRHKVVTVQVWNEREEIAQLLNNCKQTLAKGEL